MTSKESSLERFIFLAYADAALRKLLAGNDTQCFTTEQWARAYSEAIHERESNHEYKQRSLEAGQSVPLEVRRNQVRSVPGIVEVAPDVWTVRT